MYTYGRFSFLKRENNTTLLYNYSPVTFFFKKSFFGRANAFIFMKSKVYSFPFSVHDFCVLFKKILPTPHLPRFIQVFLEDSFVVIDLKLLIHFELCFAHGVAQASMFT